MKDHEESVMMMLMMRRRQDEDDLVELIEKRPSVTTSSCSSNVSSTIKRNPFKNAATSRESSKDKKNRWLAIDALVVQETEHRARIVFMEKIRKTCL